MREGSSEADGLSGTQRRCSVAAWWRPGRLAHLQVAPRALRVDELDDLLVVRARMHVAEGVRGGLALAREVGQRLHQHVVCLREHHVLLGHARAQRRVLHTEMSGDGCRPGASERMRIPRPRWRALRCSSSGLATRHTLKNSMTLCGRLSTPKWPYLASTSGVSCLTKMVGMCSSTPSGSPDGEGHRRVKAAMSEHGPSAARCFFQWWYMMRACHWL